MKGDPMNPKDITLMGGPPDPNIVPDCAPCPPVPSCAKCGPVTFEAADSYPDRIEYKCKCGATTVIPRSKPGTTRLAGVVAMRTREHIEYAMGRADADVEADAATIKCLSSKVNELGAERDRLREIVDECWRHWKYGSPAPPSCAEAARKEGDE